MTELLRPTCFRSARPRARVARLRAGVLAGLAALLAACGGGGSQDDGDAQPVPGELTRTDRPLDLGIGGDGFFVYEDADGRTVYSRVASLKQDADGALVDREGRRLRGSAARVPLIESGRAEAAAALDAVATTEALPAIPVVRPALATRSVVYDGVLDARQAAGSTPFDPHDAFSFGSSDTVTVYDARGTAHALGLYFVRDADRWCWTLHVTLDGAEVDLDAADPERREIALDFAADGRLSSPSAPVEIALAGRGKPRSGATIAIDLSGLRQAVSPTRTTRLTQDGEAGGVLRKVEVSPDGWVEAHYAGTSTTTIGRVRLAAFGAGDRLTAAGAHGWLCAEGCSAPRYAAPGALATGLIETGTLETPATR